MLKLEDFKAVKLSKTNLLNVTGAKQYTKNPETGSTRDTISDDGWYEGPEGSWYLYGY